MAKHWSEEELKEARKEGDPPVDRLVEKVLSASGEFSKVGRLNQLLDVVDKLLESPELALVKSSSIARQLGEYPNELVNYFDPMEAPAWVDNAKLEIASRLWDENMLAILGVLYAASLPSCYLIKNGIPALYESSKLKEHKYIYQRIYETGLFLDAVMSPGGLQVISDIDEDMDKHHSTVLNQLDPGGEWFWDGRALRRKNTSGQAPDSQRVTEEVRKLRPKPRRYIWGKGYIAAKKVRFLHASMRFMLTQPSVVVFDGEPGTIAESLSQPESPWNEERGKPVNQEDLAYTLLTFSYVIPIGLERWGCKWTIEEKAAFLHLWKVVGRTMGIKEGLLTDQWDEADLLFKTIRKEEAGASDQGKALTNALMDFLQDYLPSTFGIDRHVPPLLIKKQIGSEYSDMIFTEEREKDSQRLRTRLNFVVGLLLIRLYYLVRNLIFRRFDFMAAYMGNVFSQAGEELINSWRSVYARRPFYIPVDAYTWRRVKGVREDFMGRLRCWRRKLFYTLAAGIGFLISSVICSVVFLALLLLGIRGGAKISGWITLGCFLIALFILKACLPRVSRERPEDVGQT